MLNPFATFVPNLSTAIRLVLFATGHDYDHRKKTLTLTLISTRPSHAHYNDRKGVFCF